MKRLTKLSFMALATLAIAACGKDNAEEKAAAPVVSHTEASVGEILAQGTFEGRSDHITVGEVTVTKTDDGYYVTLGEDFSLDGAPDPKLGFGDGEYLAETKFSHLVNNNGKQSYKLPEGFDPSSYTQIYVWCEKFNVPLGVAALDSQS